MHFFQKCQKKFDPPKIFGFFRKKSIFLKFFKFWNFATFSAKILQMCWNSDISRKKMYFFKKCQKKIRPPQILDFFLKKVIFLKFTQISAILKHFYFEKAQIWVNEPFYPHPGLWFYNSMTTNTITSKSTSNNSNNLIYI